MANKQIAIENFIKMTPEVPQYSSRNQNYLVAGANPIYYLDEGGQEQQVGPMAASINWSFITGTDGNVTHMIPSTNGLYSTILCDDTGKVYGLTSTTLTSFGYPTGSALGSTNAGCSIATVGNIIFFTYSTTSNIYYLVNFTGGWQTLSGIQSTVGVHFMEPFLANYVAFSDGSSTYTAANQVKLINYATGTPTILSTPSVTLGKGWGIMGMRNYNDKYLAVAGGQCSAGGIANGFSQNYLFLWDGISNVYNQSIKIPGQFLDMKVINSILYVAVGTSNSKSTIYYLKNLQLVEAFTIQYSQMMATTYSALPCVLFNFGNYVGVKLQTTSDITYPLMVWGREDSLSNVEYIYSYGTLFDQIETGYDGNIYANKYNAGSFSQMFYLPTNQINGGYYQEIVYKSQWIPVKNLQSIDVYYDTPPQNATDQINVTINGRGEDIITGTSTTALNSITSTNFLNAKRTRLDCKGFTGDFLQIVLSTVNGSEYVVATPWRPIIRKIVAITG